MPVAGRLEHTKIVNIMESTKYVVKKSLKLEFVYCKSGDWSNHSELGGYEYNFRRGLRGLHGLMAALSHYITEKESV